MIILVKQQQKTTTSTLRYIIYINCREYNIFNFIPFKRKRKKREREI